MTATTNHPLLLPAIEGWKAKSRAGFAVKLNQSTRLREIR